MSIEVCWFQQRLAWSLGIAGVIPQRKANLIVFVDPVAEIPGEGSIVESVLAVRTVGAKVGASRGIVEFAEQAADLRAAAARSESAAFAKKADFRHTRRSSVSKNLHDAGNSIRAIDGAFRATHDFHFVDIVEREVRKIY